MYHRCSIKFDKTCFQDFLLFPDLQNLRCNDFSNKFNDQWSCLYMVMYWNKDFHHRRKTEFPLFWLGRHCQELSSLLSYKNIFVGCTLVPSFFSGGHLYFYFLNIFVMHSCEMLILIFAWPWKSGSWPILVLVQSVQTFILNLLKFVILDSLLLPFELLDSHHRSFLSVTRNIMNSVED